MPTIATASSSLVPFGAGGRAAAAGASAQCSERERWTLSPPIPKALTAARRTSPSPRFGQGSG